MAEQLNMEAVVKDGFSKPLKDFQAKLKDLRVTPGMRAVERNFDALKNQINQATRAIKDAGSGLVNGMGLPGLSVGALSAASAMAALGASVQSFAKNTVSIKNFADATGIAGTKLKELKAVAAGLGIDSDSIEGALRFGAGNYSAMQRGQGNYAAIANLRGGGVDIANRLKGARNADEYTERGLEILNQQKTAEQRRTLSGLIFGSEDMAAFGVEGSAALAKRRAATRASLGSQTGIDEKNAQAFLDATSKVSASIDKLTNSIGGSLAPFLTQLAESINAFSNENAGEVKSFFTEVGKALRDHDWKSEASNVTSVISALKSFATAMQEIQDGAAKAGVWVHDFVAGLPGQVKDQAGKIGEAGKSMVDPKAPGANNGVKIEDLGGYSPIAYRPGARAALTGMASVSSAVATIAAGVTKGMQDFAASLQGGGAAGEGDGGAGGGFGGGGGFMKASYQPGGGARGALNGIRAVRSSVGAAIKKYKDADYNVPDGTPGQYRPAYKLSDADLSDEVVNIINGEATSSKLSTDAVINNMFNRLGTKAYGPSSNLRAVALAPGQYAASPRTKTSSSRAAFIRERIKAIASGSVPDVTSGSNEYRAGWYNGPWGRKHADSPVIGGNRFAYNPKVPPGPYAPYTQRPSASDAASKKAAADAANASAGKGKVDIHVHSKDQPVTMKTDDSPVFGETKLNRGRSVPLMDL